MYVSTQVTSGDSTEDADIIFERIKKSGADRIMINSGFTNTPLEYQFNLF